MAECPKGSDDNPARVPHLLSLEDAKLVQRVRAGQTEAFGELVAKYQDRVFNACWRICGHLEDARDLTQEAFLKAFKALGSFNEQSGFYTWLFRIAVNLSLTHRGMSARRGDVSLDAMAAAGTQAEALIERMAQRRESRPDQPATQEELRGSIAHALASLDVQLRAVIVLREIEGFDYREIAEILEVPVGTVRSRLHRARSTLADIVRKAPAAGL